MGRKKIKLSPFAAVILIALITLATVGAFVAIHNISQNAAKEPVIQDQAFPTEVYGVTVKTALMPEDNPARTGIIREIKYIVIHETGNTSTGANAERHSEYLFNGNNGDTSWHYTVDDTEIYHNVPDNELAWHAGDTKNPDGGNAHGIGIELCVNEDGDFEKTLDNGAKLTAYLMKQYGLDISAVTQHADYMDKDCPEILRNTGRWDEFLGMVQNYFNKHKDD